MVFVLEGGDRKNSSAIFDQLFQLRYDIFVARRKWSLPVKGNHEVDQYDSPDAVYFIDMNSDGIIEGHVRLTPTTSHSLLADYFPHLIADSTNPRSANIYEATRYIVRPIEKSRAANRAAKSRLLVAMLEWGLTKELSHIQTVIDSAALASFVDMTSQTKPLGLSHPFGGGATVPGGGECMAIRWPVTQEVKDDLIIYGNGDEASEEEKSLNH